MSPLPKFKINDQVVLQSKDQNISYSLGIVQHAQKNGEWEYKVKIDGKYAFFKEAEISGVVFESKDYYSSENLKTQEDLTKLI